MKSSNHCRLIMQPLLVTYFAVVIIILLGGLTSCGPVKQCDEVGQEFYKCLKSKNYGQILQYLDEEVIKETPERIMDVLVRKDHDFGMLLKQECYGFDNETHDNVTRIAIKYRVYYSKCTLFERLEFIQRQSGYKITYYKFDVDSALVE